jgi:hypothetical protein
VEHDTAVGKWVAGEPTSMLVWPEVILIVSIDNRQILVKENLGAKCLHFGTQVKSRQGVRARIYFFGEKAAWESVEAGKMFDMGKSKKSVYNYSLVRKRGNGLVKCDKSFCLLCGLLIVRPTFQELLLPASAAGGGIGG